MISFPVATYAATYDETLKVSLEGGLEDCVLVMRIKNKHSDPDSASLVALRSTPPGSGLELLSVVDGVARIRIVITDEQMAALKPRTYQAGIKVLKPDGTSEPIKTLSQDFQVSAHPVGETAAGP